MPSMNTTMIYFFSLGSFLFLKQQGKTFNNGEDNNKSSQQYQDKSTNAQRTEKAKVKKTSEEKKHFAMSLD